MTQDAMTAQVRRWQLVTLAALALLVGYIAGQAAPVASAQQGVTAVQLNTSNCRTGSVDSPSGLAGTSSDISGVPDGAIVTATYLTVDPNGRTVPRFIYTVCR